jgi:hypothetical protein
VNCPVFYYKHKPTAQFVLPDLDLVVYLLTEYKQKQGKSKDKEAKQRNDQGANAKQELKPKVLTGY